MYTKEYKILASDVGYNKELTLSSMLRIFQDIATEHGELIGVGRDTLLNKGLIWVASRTTVEINRLPIFNEDIILETAPDATIKTMFPRYIQFKDKFDNVLLKACTIWVLVDINTRNMVFPENYGVEIDPSHFDRLDVFAQNVKKLAYENIDYKRVNYSDLDYNGHMNNTKYADIVQNLLIKNLSDIKKFKSFKIVYSKEAKLNETIKLEYIKNESMINVYGSIDDQKVFAAELTYEQ